MPKKLTSASWHTPVLGADCPYCGEWNDLFGQFQDHEYPFEILRSAVRTELKGIEFQCDKCDKAFELSDVCW